jgi:predicted Zn-dependent peptidase
VHAMGIEQVHMLLGCSAPCRSDERHFAAALLSTVLVDGPSSRMFVSIREKRGLVYGIQSNYDAKSNAGMLGIYCALAPENVPLVLDLIGKELRSLSLTPPSLDEVERAKCKYRTQVAIERESSLGQVSNLVGPYLSLGRIQPLSELMQLIEDVSPGQIHNLASDLFKPEQVSISLVGNVNGLNQDELVLSF